MGVRQRRREEELEALHVRDGLVAELDDPARAVADLLLLQDGLQRGVEVDA